MASKATTGKTNRYSGVVKNIKDTKSKVSQPMQPEEPRITPEQVVAAFKSFGFEPNQNNHNDIAYWTTKGQSEGAKLIEELHKKRVDINNKQEEETRAAEDHNKKVHDTIKQHEESKQTLPRLSDQELNAMFDEYGLPAPDPEWARTHLPNDPAKIRSILEMQRKAADDVLKKQTKNAINSMPEVPKPQPGMQGQPAPMMGMGGPLGAQGAMVGDEGPATPFFIGDHSLVRITNQTNPNASTTWLVDAKKKVLRPFASEAAFQNAFEDPEAAEKSVITISTKELGPGGALDGFTPLQASQGVQEDGSFDSTDVSPAELQNRYGQPQDTALENKSLSMLDGIFSGLSSQQDPETQDINQQ